MGAKSHQTLVSTIEIDANGQTPMPPPSSRRRMVVVVITKGRSTPRSTTQKIGSCKPGSSSLYLVLRAHFASLFALVSRRAKGVQRGNNNNKGGRKISKSPF